MAGAARELATGVGLIGRGLGLIARRPRLFALGAVPPTITSVLFVIVLVVLGRELDRVTRFLTPFADGLAPQAALVVRVLVGVALVGGAVLLMVVTFTGLTLALGSPLYDKLSESCEREFGPVPQWEEPVLRGVGRGLRQALALVAVSALGALALFASGFIPVVGQTLVPVLSALFGGWILAIELVGPAFERRGLLRIADRRAALRRHRLRVLGFAVPVFLLLAIPFLGVVVFPVATAAGTLLARQLLREPT